jgi:hypothetical protein
MAANASLSEAEFAFDLKLISEVILRHCINLLFEGVAPDLVASFHEEAEGATLASVYVAVVALDSPLNSTNLNSASNSLFTLACRCPM